jgi:polyphosphate glucokinase
MPKKAVGIDIGGSGIKAGLVDTRDGELVSERLRVDTPLGAEPKAVIDAVAALVDQLAGEKPNYAVGISVPAVVRHGVTMSAANISSEWIGFRADVAFSAALDREVHLINDADAAGVAEVRFGAGRNQDGLVIMTTLGTGIGTALFFNGTLVPNSELGHLEIDGVDIESVAANSAREREGLSFEQWAARLQRFYETLERLLSPDLFIVGGGVSKQHSEFLQLLRLDTPIVVAESKNNAGIIGSAALAKRT